MSGREVVGGCLAPAFVRGKKCDPLSVIDIASAAAGGVVVGLETVINARKVIRHKLNLLP
jgi:hypothetical protein